MDKPPKRKLKPIEICPNGHYYNSSRTGEICDVCGAKLDPPQPEELSEEERLELAYIEQSNWVCGWIVCVRGANKGRAYEIHEGKNFIGSSSAMDIQIVGDNRVEKKNHAVIMYDPMKKKTMLLASGSRGMVYLKGEAVYEPVTLEPFIDITFGDSLYIYAPLCGADFSWDDPEKKADAAAL